MASAAVASGSYPPRATDVAHAWLRAPLYRELQSEAIRRGEHVDELAGKLITAIIVLGDVDEVLDRAGRMLDGG